MFRFDIVPAMRIGCAACASSKPLVAAPPNPVPNSGANRVVAFCVSPPPPRIEPEAAAAAGIALARLLWPLGQTAQRERRVPRGGDPPRRGWLRAGRAR